MKRIVAAAFLAAATGLAAGGAAAQADLDAALVAKARPFLEAENPRGTPATIDATVTCVMAVLGELPSELKTQMIAAPDFEDALDLLVKTRPDTERPLEACF